MQNNNGSRVIPTTVFLLYRKLLVSYKVKNAPRGCASRGEEVSCKQHRSSAKESQATLCSINAVVVLQYIAEKTICSIKISSRLQYHHPLHRGS